MSQSNKSTVAITGASTGIGATYADRFAKRGHDLLIIARNEQRLNALAERLRAETGVKVDILVADLTDAADLAKVEDQLASLPNLGILVNNAGMAAHGGFTDATSAEIRNLITLNVTALSQLSAAVIPRFVENKAGAIINIASVVGLAPELPLGYYGATKSFVIALSHAMNIELAATGVHVQAVLPAATRTEIWERSGRNVNDLDGVMDVNELVDAALAGFYKGETITIPPLHDENLWLTLEDARKAMLPHLLNGQAAPRYQA